MENGIEFGNMGFILVLLGVLVHGICYDFFFVSGQVYTDQATDPKIRGQAQSMIIFGTQGLGMWIGAMINEKLFMRAFGVENIGDAYGKAAAAENLSDWSNFWWPLCGFAAVILIIFVLCFKHKDKKVVDPHGGGELEESDSAEDSAEEVTA